MVGGRAGTLAALREAQTRIQETGVECNERSLNARAHGKLTDYYWFAGQAAGLRHAWRVLAVISREISAVAEGSSHVNADNRGQLSKGGTAK